MDGLFVDEVETSLLETITELEKVATSLNMENLGADEFNRIVNEVEVKSKEYLDVSTKLNQFYIVCPELKDTSFEILRKINSIIDNTGKDLFSLRCADTKGPESEKQISLILQTARDFKTKHATVNARLDLTRLGSEEFLRKQLNIIESTGFFGRMFSAYKSAFAYGLRAHKSTQKLNRYGMIANLTDAVNVLAELNSFKKEAAYNQRLPDVFKGMDTDFELLENYMQFLHMLDKEFSGIEGRIIKDFILQQPYDVLSDIPVTGHLETVKDDAELCQKIEQIEDKKQELLILGKRFSGLASVFTRAASVKPQNLPDIGRNVVSFCEARELVFKDTKIKQFIGKDVSVGKINSDYMGKERRISKWINEKDDPTRELVKAFYLRSSENEESEKILKFLSAVDTYWQRAKEVEEKTNVLFALPDDRSYQVLCDQLNSAGEDVDGLMANAGFHISKQNIEEYGFLGLVELLIELEDSLDNIENVMEATYSRCLAVSVYGSYGASLTKFKGEKLSGLRKRIADLDLKMQKLGRDKIFNDLISAAKPLAGKSRGRKSEYTEMAMLQHQVGLKRGYQPVRELVRRAGASLQELKPCWMMSPLAIAQYIEKGSVEFDLCIIDEASQMTVENSIGAILRSKQVMIVGDTNQLPPTSFFKKMIDVKDDVDEDLQITEESILDKANSVLTKRQLRWHYRSRHSALIAYSNKNVYDDKLIVFPSANEGETNPNMGVKLVRTQSSYKSGVNKLEIDVVVAHVMKFMKYHPKRSLGVVALNKAQAGLIEQEIEYARFRHSHMQKYFEYWELVNDGLESFFVKNLENVQGDERDVIFISTVYGADSEGVKPAQRFGPINGAAGKRRLNVLFSRAKEQIVTFTSLNSTDITLEDEALSNGKSMLKGWLEYSATGKLPAADFTGREPDSDFEIAVIREIEAMGLQAIPQVGSSNYFIDIGVKHPNYPYGFVLAVECDGATYHSSKSARDRDRIRQSVLEGLGWHFHRIWSTDWFDDPATEINRLRNAIEDRMKVLQVEMEKRAQEPVVEDVIEFLDDESSLELPFDDEVTPQIREDSVIEDGDEVAEIEEKPTFAKTDIVSDFSSADEVEVGDRVTFRYLDRDKNTVKITLSDIRNDVENGIVSIDTTLGEALLGAELEEEIDFLAGSYLRRGVIESIEKKGV
ncbi:MAG: GreA/GreB family elongation factor [Sneathiella sp.]|nr:GreA/GreB family elongation factor [Sneathiella sp.]